MVRLLKKFIDHQKALWNDEAENPPIIAWTATLLFVPSAIFSFYFGKYLNQNIVPYLPIPMVLKVTLFLLIYIYFPIIISGFVANNAK